MVIRYLKERNSYWRQFEWAFGTRAEGYNTTHGGFGYRERNNGDVSILYSAIAHE